MAKTLVHKRDEIEVVTINGLLQDGANGLVIVGETGETIDLGSALADFVGENVSLVLRKKETEEIQVLE